MKILVTGNLGYVGTTTTEYLKNQGYEVVGLDSGFYRECLLVPLENKIITKNKDIRDVEISDFAGIDAVVHLAALSNDPIGELDESLTYEINYKAAVRTAELAKAAKVKRFIFDQRCEDHLWLTHLQRQYPAGRRIASRTAEECRRD
jgi:nucleoside-diphosphate-sugar epimerase